MLWSFRVLVPDTEVSVRGRTNFLFSECMGQTGILYAFDYNGKLVWKKEYGAEWD